MSGFMLEMKSGEELKRSISAGRHVWVQVLRGDVSMNGQSLKEGDGASASAGDMKMELTFIGSGANGCEILLFDLA